MYYLKFLCFWKTFTKLSASINRFIVDFLFLVCIEFVKYCAVLLITFGFGYLIFCHGSANSADETSLLHDLKSERLSSGLIQNGSFSKFPFVVELPAKASVESLKKQFRIRHSRPQNVKDAMAQNT